ncbi:hypothetical protein [Shewanella colwelliana]|uniref:hypothetical protein n=1 Tax=Shewanella colwelliana TaxID=23 RepID=UPI003736C97C
MSVSKYSPTKTTLQKIKNEAKKLNNLGSLQERQNIVAQSFGYKSYHEFFQAYKININLMPGNHFEGMGCFAGEFLLGGTDEQKKLLNMLVLSEEEYEITHRFQLENNGSSNLSIKRFCEKIEPHIQDYASLLFKVQNKQAKINSYVEFLDSTPDYNLRSVDIVVGVDFPNGLSPQEEFKFAERWFFDEGKGGRISLSNFPNDGLVSKKAVYRFFSIIRAVAEQTFNMKCYVFPSIMHQDIKWDESQKSQSSH